MPVSRTRTATRPSGRGRGLDADLPALGRELDRVVHEVHQDLDEAVPVRADGETRRHGALQGLAALGGLALEHGRDPGDDVAQVEPHRAPA